MSMQISPGGAFPLILLGTRGKWYFHLGDWKGLLVVIICFPPAAAWIWGRDRTEAPLPSQERQHENLVYISFRAFAFLMFF